MGSVLLVRICQNELAAVDGVLTCIKCLACLLVEFIMELKNPLFVFVVFF